MPKIDSKFVDALSRTLKKEPSAQLVVGQSAAVSVIFRDDGDGEKVLLIKHADRVDDPWSGHMAFPGGRVDVKDASFLDTAMRETEEEVGIDLSVGASVFLGYMGSLRPRTGAVMVVPCVFKLTEPVLVALNDEVAVHEWIPLRDLAAKESRAPYHVRREGQDFELPSFVYHGLTIWGMTERILSAIVENAEEGED